MRNLRFMVLLMLQFAFYYVSAEDHPRIYISDDEKDDFLLQLENSARVRDFVENLKVHINPYVDRHQADPEWIVSRLQMYWKTKYTHVFVDGMDFSYGEGSAPVPTVRFSGSRDWDTDYLLPAIEDILPYMDDPRGLYLQNGKREGQPWEWVHPSETGHIVERINRMILDLAEEAAFLYWLGGEEKYAVFASDIFMTYITGMYHRNPPITVGNHGNRWLMGLQTFEVIHEGVIEPVTICYDFLYDYLKKKGKDLIMIQQVFRKWADQEIQYGVPDNNWNLMQARFITHLALALEDDESYEDHKGQQYYIDQVMNQNSFKQKALKDVLKNYDPMTAIWPEVAHYSIMVSDDILEIYSLMDKTLDNNLLTQYPLMEKAVLANFNYLFPNGFTTAYGDAKHARLRFNSLELLISQYRKYGQKEKEDLITRQLKCFIEDGAYDRDQIHSLFQLFFYADELNDVPPAASFEDLVYPTFYSPNVSWIVQRNGSSLENGMMISKNASLGNHSHTNGVNIELYAKGMVIAPDCAAGVSYWSKDHIEYYSRFPAHNTVIVDGISDYRNMRGTVAFSVNAIYPSIDNGNPLFGDVTYSDVTFTEPSTDALQRRFTATVRGSAHSGYFIDIFRSARQDGQDKKHEYLFHGQGAPIILMDQDGSKLATSTTSELSSKNGDLVGYDYFTNKQEIKFDDHFVARFSMPTILNTTLHINCWFRGSEGRTIFTAEAPYSRAIHPESVPEALYHKALPTLIVRQDGEAKMRPFVNIIDVFDEDEGINVTGVDYFSANGDSKGFVGIVVHSDSDRTDYIYNDEDPTIEHHFTDGEFQGNFGTISCREDELQDLVLGNGKVVSKDAWKIETNGVDATIYVRKTENGFAVDADGEFTLTMPALKTDKRIFLEFESDTSRKAITGKLRTVGGERIAQFEIPSIKNTSLRIKRKP